MDFLAAANEIGFSHIVEFDPKILEARDAVRAMCAEDRCRAYGKNWSCSPNCGTVEECQASPSPLWRATDSLSRKSARTLAPSTLTVIRPSPTAPAFYIVINWGE